MNLQKKLIELEKKYHQIEDTNKELASKLSELFILYNLTRILTTTFELNKVFQNIFKLFAESLPIDYSVLIFDENFAKSMHLDRNYGIGKEKSTVFPVPGKAVYEAVLHSGSTLQSKIDPSDLETIPRNRLFNEPIQFVAFAISLSKQSTVGALFFFRRAGNEFSSSEINFLGQISKEVSNILDKIVLFYETKEDTYRDYLTGAFNRRYFNHRLETEIKRAERYRRNLSILMIDLDDFKQINDRFGHVVGDGVLRNMAKIIRENLRTSDVLVRYGGEEFVVILPETTAQEAYLVAEKLRAAVELNQILPVSSNAAKPVTISIGVANFPLDANSGEKLVEISDTRLYLAKSKGKNCTIHTHIS